MHDEINPILHYIGLKKVVLHVIFMLLSSTGVLLAGNSYLQSAIVENPLQPGIAITGTVVDAEGNPMPGVNIVLKGTRTGTISDTNGRYSITVPDRNTVLQFSFVGFVTLEVKAGDLTVLNIEMKESTKEFEEVVVVAYGAQKKVTVTGAIATVQTKELKQSSSANLSVALAGRLSGLTALQSSGMPGYDAVNLYLRGVGTTNGASPLILIDGVPRENLNSLDPNEVASVSILKDASSTAVFGVRGANGVILVTTKRGDSDKPQLSVSSEYGMQSLAAQFDRIHSWEYADLRNQAASNDGVSEENLPFTPYMIQKYCDGSDPVFYPDRDIYHDFFHDFAPQTRFNLNYSGKNDKISYFVNAGYLNQQGLVKTESPESLGYDPSYKLNRYNFRVNVDYNLFDNLKLSANIASYMELMNGSHLEEGSIDYTMLYMMTYAWKLSPTLPGPTTKPGYGVPENQVIDNAGNNVPVYGVLNRSGYFTRNSTQFTSSVGLEWGLDFITPGLSTKVMISYDGNYYTQLGAYRQFQYYGFDIARTEEKTSSYVTIRGADVTDESISLSKFGSSRYYMNLQYTLNYTRKFGKHDFTGMFLLQRDNWEYNNADLPYNILGMSGRVTYNYDQRYMAEFNAGYNGSEQFHKDHRFGFFPAFSAGWVVSNESFLKDNNLLTYLKLRASYGKVGNDKLGSERFLYRTQMSEVGGGISDQLGMNKRIIEGRMGNESLSWEIAEKQNYGIDLQLFREFSVSFDVFSEERNNVFFSRGMVPIFQGVPIANLPKLNIGRVHNWGYEAEATWNKRLNNGLAFIAKGNFAYNRNKMVYMDEPMLPDDYATRYRSTGYSIGQFFGYTIDRSNGNGYINTPEELEWAKEAYKIGNPRLGDIKYSDENGDGVIDSKDEVPIGYPQVPHISYGFSGNISFKGFDFSFLLTGIAQSSIYLDSGISEFGAGSGSFFSDIHRNAWTEERYINGKNITYPALSLMTNTNHLTNDFIKVPDRSFLKLKNVELGYSLPSKWLQPMKISSLRVYTNGNNLWTVWTKIPVKTIDPEQTTNLVLPIMKMVNFGLNIVF